MIYAVILLTCFFNIANTEESWETDDIKRAFRADEPKNRKPRMVLMKFRYDYDKHKIFQGRDALRDRGIRVGKNDLTRRQRENMPRNGSQVYLDIGLLYRQVECSKYIGV